MRIILASNSNLEAVAFGPYKTDKKAEQMEKRLLQQFPTVSTVILELHKVPLNEPNRKS